MKNTLKTFIGIGLLMMGGGIAGAAGRGALIEFETVEAETVKDVSVAKQLKDFPDGKVFRYNIKGVLPVAGNQTGLKALRDTLMTRAGITDAATGVAMKSYSQAAEGPGSLYVDIDVKTFDTRFLVYEVSNEIYYSGAAHPSTITHNFSYFIPEGKMLTTCDVLKCDAKDKVLGLVRDKLKNPDTGTFEDAWKTAQLPGDYVIDGNGVTFIYQPYEVGPYAAGLIKVPLYYWELESNGCLKPGVYKKMTGIDPTI